ncbi:hypothetical protein AAII07_59415, partial [Microvirga sp. 0TCS3.31]
VSMAPPQTGRAKRFQVQRVQALTGRSGGGALRDPDITVLRDGRYVINWTRADGTVAGQIFDTRDKSVSVTGLADQENFFYGTGLGDILSGGAKSDKLFGEGSNDTLYSNGGIDSLSGGSGNDKIYGGDGDDTIDGGTGADEIEGGQDFDIVTYADSNQRVKASLLSNAANADGAAGDTFISIEGLIGSNGDDELIGNGGGQLTCWWTGP